MKILLSWIFDYIDYPLCKVNVAHLVHLFNTRTAEIEHFERISIPYDQMYLIQQASKTKSYCSELYQDLTLPERSDLIVGAYYFVIKRDIGYVWASLSDFGVQKDGLVPALTVSDELVGGAWRELIAHDDYILDIDNKSINHRPDLWGHYGIAREIAAFLGLPLKPLHKVLQKIAIVHSNQDQSHSIELSDTKDCARVAGWYCKTIKQKHSDLFTAIRLMLVGAKPINGMVDLTNYVMFDIGHPMHVFDARVFPDKKMIVRKAKNGETLKLLDGQEALLQPEDIVIANNSQVVSLAGIMGGFDSGFNQETKDIFLEAAGFDPVVIRKTAQRLKIRTEASARFEKHLDPMGAEIVLKRFIYLAKKQGLISSIDEPILYVGNTVEPLHCVIQHSFIEKKIGMSFDTKTIVHILKSIEFGCQVKKVSGDIIYDVIVPTYRISKDINIKEDIVEEIVRLYGFENITYQLPERAMTSFDTHVIRTISDIKKYCAFGAGMHEIREYLFYDESFLQKLSYQPETAVEVKHSVSQNWKRLVTSLIPHMFKNVVLNDMRKDHIRFFEMNHVWKSVKEEKNSFAGIIYDKKSLDFYDGKKLLQGLWDLLRLRVVYKKPQETLAPWYDEYKTAELFIGDISIGFAGMVSENFVKNIFEGEAFIFEIDADFLINYRAEQDRFIPWSKYQDVFYDISLFIPLKVTVDELKFAILNAHSTIMSVDLIDFFEKDEWDNQRAVTLRYRMSDKNKTLEKQEIDEIVQSVQSAVKKYDAQIR